MVRLLHFACLLCGLTFCAPSARANSAHHQVLEGRPARLDLAIMSGEMKGSLSVRTALPFSVGDSEFGFGEHQYSFFVATGPTRLQEMDGVSRATTEVPEPISLLLIGTGLIGISKLHGRRTRQRVTAKDRRREVAARRELVALTGIEPVFED